MAVSACCSTHCPLKVVLVVAVPDKEEGKELAAAAETEMKQEEAEATKQDAHAKEQELQVPLPAMTGVLIGLSSASCWALPLTAVACPSGVAAALPWLGR